MSHELWVKVPRGVIRERGYGITHLPGERVGELSGTFALDPFCGYATCEVLLSLADAYAWEAADESWVETAAFANPDGSWVDGQAHRSEAAFRRATSDVLPRGDGFFLAFIVYQGTPAFDVEFGGGYRLNLEQGVGELFRRVGDDWQTIGLAWLWDVEEWVGRRHFLYVYCVGTRLIVRRLGDQRGLGTMVEVGPKPGGYALQEGPITVSGSGFLVVAAAPERHAQTLDFEHAVIRLPEPLTSEPTATVDWLAPADLTPDEIGNDNAPAIELTQLGDSPHEQFGYRVSGTLDRAIGPNVYVTRVRVVFPRTIASDGLTPVNLLATPGVAVREMVDRRSTDVEGCGLDFVLRAERGLLGAYLDQDNLRVSWRPYGVQRADAYSTRPELALGYNTEDLTFGCELGWKRFKRALWTGEGSFGGRLLAEAYRDVAKRAGLDDADISIYAGGYRLPSEDADGRPLFDFRPGQSIADVLTYLRDQFGAEDILRFKPDGRFWAEERPTTASGVVFYWSTPPSEVIPVALGTSTLPRIYRDTWREQRGELPANEVFIVGQDRAGKPLVAWATDWPSINDPDAENYVGEFRRLVIVDAGLTTQAIVGWVCRQVFERVRRRPLTARFEAMYVPGLLEWDLVGIDGRGTWRIVRMETRWPRGEPAGRSAYDVEWLG